MPANDVLEQVFNEKQLYNCDVVGEDDDAQDPRPVLLPNGRLVLSHSQGAREFERASTASGFTQSYLRSEGFGDVYSSSAGSTSPPATRQKRRKKPSARASQIIVVLETKYDVLRAVCETLPDWKEATSPNSDFDLLWCDTAISADRFMKLKTYQKMNHFVGMSSITRKNNLGRNLLRMRKQFPNEYKFFPDTWILPTDLGDFKMQFGGGKKQTFIVKPDNSCQGKGIFLVNDIQKVPTDFSQTYVAQRYVHKPFLLDGYKFDLRLYALVLGCDPLRIFLHRRSLCRLASELYVEPTAKNLSQPMMHLTNYAVNKENPNFEENTNPEDPSDGHKRSWEAVAQQMRADSHDVDALQADIEDLIIKTLISVQPSLTHFYRSCQPEDMENSMCFEILGFDVMLDYKLQPWLLEVNHAPSFATESELDRIVKEDVLTDTFNMLNFCPEARRQKKRDAREKIEQRALGSLGKKPTMEERLGQERAIAQKRSEFEIAHCGGYKLLYPSDEKEREYMHIHEGAINIWDMLMGGNSRRVVRLTSNHDDAIAPPLVRKLGVGPNPSSSSASDTKTAPTEKPTEKRSPEDMREVFERLSNGVSSRPRKDTGSSRRARTNEAPVPPHVALAPTTDPLSPSLAAGVLGPEKYPTSWSDLKTGDVVKVQTNMGWEGVTIRIKRPNGKIDIQFSDGEVMRAVMPRVLMDPVTEAWIGEKTRNSEAMAVGGVSGRGTSLPPRANQGVVPPLTVSGVVAAQVVAGEDSGGASGKNNYHPSEYLESLSTGTSQTSDLEPRPPRNPWRMSPSDGLNGGSMSGHLSWRRHQSIVGNQPSQIRAVIPPPTQLHALMNIRGINSLRAGRNQTAPVGWVPTQLEASQMR